LCSGVLVSFRQKMSDPTKISNGEPKLVREVVIDRGRVSVGSARKLLHRRERVFR
jgi:hypothetical protein